MLSNWIKTILYGVRTIQADGVTIDERGTLNFIGLSVSDDPVNDRTDVAFIGAYFPTPDPQATTVMSRNSVGASTCTALGFYDDIAPAGVETAYISGPSGTMFATNGFTFASEVVDVVLPYIPIYDPSLWSLDSVGRVVNAGGTADSVFFDLDIPQGVTLETISVSIQAATPHSDLPADMPRIRIYEIEFASGVANAMDSMIDASPTVSDYEDVHTIDITGPFAIDRTIANYRLEFISEGGANALAGLTVLGISATYTTNTYRK